MSSIFNAFNGAASSYDAFADVQHRSAKRLAQLISTTEIEPGPVIELGCGTGIFTQYLLELFPDRQIEITDLCPKMVLRCLEKHGPQGCYAACDGEQLVPDQQYALITSNFVAQWFADPQGTLNRLNQYGPVACAFPVEGSFVEWQQACELADVPFLANPLPAAIGLSEIRAEVMVYPSPLDFFRTLKGKGANRSVCQRQLTVGQVRRLDRAWKRRTDGNIEVTYRVGYRI